MKNEIFIKEVKSFRGGIEFSTFTCYNTLTGLLKSEGLLYLYQVIRYVIFATNEYEHENIIIRKVNRYH